MKIPVNQDRDTLIEYRDAYVEQRQDIENLAIGLEFNPYDSSALKQLRAIFDELWFSSTKLELAPISDNVDSLIKVLDFMSEQQFYEPSFSEYLLLLVDRLLTIIKDVEYSGELDMLQAQNIEVSLQKLILSGSQDEFSQQLPFSVSYLAGVQLDESAAVVEEVEIELFGDDVDLFDEPVKNEPLEVADIFVPDLSMNPVTQAKEYMQHREKTPLAYLGELSDRITQHGEEHTKFLQEICLALNTMAGEPVDQEDLWMAICLHDIGLGHLQDILGTNKKLSDDEWQQVREHPVIGSNLAEQFIAGGESKQIILDHHERLDGRGYPYGLKHNQISEGGKLLALVDSFHAMMRRFHCNSHSKNVLRAVSEINACSGTHYDPQWVKLFNRCIRSYWMPEKTK